MRRFFNLLIIAVLIASVSSILKAGYSDNTLISLMSPQEVKVVDRFTSIHIGISADVYYTVGNKHEIKLEGDKDDIADLIIKVDNGALSFRYPNYYGNRSRLTIYIVSKELEGVRMSGSGTFNAEEKISVDEIDLVVSGSGKILFSSLTADEVGVKISGSGDVKLNEGSADECDAIISGSGKFLAQAFTVEEFSIKISGSGSCRISVNSDLEAIISGSGRVYYYGSPTINSVVSGSGKVKQIK